MPPFPVMILVSRKYTVYCAQNYYKPEFIHRYGIFFSLLIILSYCFFVLNCVLNTLPKTTILYIFVFIKGELLESMGRFTLAAEVYSEAANHFKREKPTLDLNGGLAFKRGKLYDKAEHQYIKCLSMGHNKDKKELLFNNIILNYEHWLHQDIGNNEINSLLIGFSALLFSAGYTMQCIKMWGQQRRKILKNKFLVKSNALNHVNHIMTFNSDSVQEFRSAIFTCMKQNRNFKAGILIPDSRSEKEKKALDKNAAKKTLRMYNEAVTVKCDNCGIMGAEFKQCPCLLVAYCGRDCQLKQWSTHKKVCPIARK